MDNCGNTNICAAVGFVLIGRTSEHSCMRFAWLPLADCFSEQPFSLKTRQTQTSSISKRPNALVIIFHRRTSPTKHDLENIVLSNHMICWSETCSTSKSTPIDDLLVLLQTQTFIFKISISICKKDANSIQELTQIFFYLLPLTIDIDTQSQYKKHTLPLPFMLIRGIIVRKNQL